MLQAAFAHLDPPPLVHTMSARDLQIVQSGSCGGVSFEIRVVQVGFGAQVRSLRVGSSNAPPRALAKINAEMANAGAPAQVVFGCRTSALVIQVGLAPLSPFMEAQRLTYYATSAPLSPAGEGASPP